MFDRAAPRYDLLNSLMSLGRDAAWRRELGRALGPGQRVLDLCCGSARSAVADHRRTGTPVVGLDLSARMLYAGRAHAAARGARFAPVRGDAFRMPFRDASFDAVTVAWGLRNLAPEPAALAELWRVLRPGGWLHILDSPAPAAGLVGAAHRAYLRGAVPLLGRLSADPEAYRYLADSILAFGTAEEVAARLAAAGFECRPPVTLFGGAAAVWRARRPAGAPEPVRNATSGAGSVPSARPAAGTDR
jgi:demethylmenaquinone methyltransferase/2-methoxy-6-polyprenyl-1,4-benzoquinol methylase